MYGGFSPLGVVTVRSSPSTNVGPWTHCGEGELAPSPRTLVDVFRATVEQAADEPAVDAANGVLTYAELAEAADELAAELNAHGIGRGDKVGVRVNSGTTDLYVAILGIVLCRRGVRPGRRRRPGRAGPAGLRRGRRLGDRRQRPDRGHAPRRAGPRPRGARPGRRRLGDLHLRLDRYAEGRGGHPPQRRGVRGRRVPDVPPGRATGRRRPGDGRAVGGLRRAPARRCGWPGGTAAAWSPRPGRWSRAASTSGPWLVANDITVVSTVPTLVALWPTESLAGVRLLIMGGEACPPELGGPAWWRPVARCGTPTARPRPPSSPAARS